MKLGAVFSKVLCFLGMVVLLIPMIVYAVTISLSSTQYPSGGSGPPVNAYFVWSWSIYNDRVYSISANANPETCRFKRVAFPSDQVVYSLNPATIYNSSIPASQYWNSSTSGNANNVMQSGNKYYWNWDSWNCNTSTGDSGSQSAGTAGTYTCN